MRPSSPAKSATAIMSDNMDRSAASRTDSDLASSASLAIWSVAQAARRDIRPTAWSRLPRRYASTSARTSESLAQRWAVRSDTPLALAHSAHDLPAANAAASSLWRLVRSSLDMVLIIARWQGPPRLPLAPLAVLSPGPRLAGALNGQGKNGGNWRFFEGQKRHFSVLGVGASKHKPMIRPLLCRPTTWHAEGEKKVSGMTFSGEEPFDVTRSDRLRPDAADLMTCGRHGDAAQPWRGEKLILIRVVLAGLCSLLLLRRQMDQHLHGGRLSQPRSGDIVKPGGVSPRFCIPQNDSQAPKGRHRPPALSSLEIAGLLADVAPAGGSGKYAVTLVPGLTPPGFMISPHSP